MSSDLRATLTISIQEALSGTVRTLPLPDGQRITITIPADAYDGQILWFPGQVRAIKEDERPGTLILTLRVGPAEGASLPIDNEATASTTPAQVVMSMQETLPDATPDRVPTTPPRRREALVAPSSYIPDQQLPNLSTLSHPYKVATANRRPRFNQVVILAVAALFFILGSGGIFFALHTPQMVAHPNVTTTTGHPITILNSDDATATSTVKDFLTTTASTATTQAQATATQVAANPNPYISNGGTLIFYDALDGNKDSTNEALWETTGCTFSNKTLHALDDNPSYSRVCQLPGALEFRNFTLEVKAQILRGDTAQIFFRGALILKTGYLFSIDQVGSYQVVRLGLPGFQSTAPSIQLQGSSAAILRGYNQTNTIGIVAQGSTMTLYVNRQKIGSVNDPNFPSGEIGLVSSTYANHSGTTEVAFSNLRIWQL